MPILLLAGHIVFLIVALTVSGMVPVRRRGLAAQEDRHRRIVKILSLGLLFVVYIVAPIPLRVMGGSAGFDVVFLLLFGWVGLLFWTGACALWWRIIDVYVHRITASRRVWIALVLLPVLLIGSRAVYRSWPSVRAACILRNAELAPLPPSARGLKVNLWFTPMSGEGYLRFNAARDDIAHFLATSPILRDVEYVKHPDDQGRYFCPRDHRNPKSPENFHRYVSRDNGAPRWIIEELRPSMIRYSIDPAGIPSGALIVDEEDNLVFVKLSFD